MKRDRSSIQIDRDPRYFCHILNYLRHGIDHIKKCGILDKPIWDVKGFCVEARAYGLDSLAHFLDLKVLQITERQQQQRIQRMVRNIPEEDLKKVFLEHTLDKNLEFEAMAKSDHKGTYHMVFGREVSNSEARLLARLNYMSG